MSRVHGFALVALTAVLGVSGCGMPGAPQPPSLNLPQPVGDLTAVRTGNAVALHWTMPKKNTDKLLLKGNVEARLCRSEGAGNCEAVGSGLELAPGDAGTFTETLPEALASGEPQVLGYFVELRNRNGRSAGKSNQAVVLTGAAPAPLTGLTAEVRKDGVVLRWHSDGGKTAVRLHRRLLTPATTAQHKTAQKGMMAPQPEPAEQSLLVEAGAEGKALDQAIRFGASYEYQAQRVVRLQVDGKPLELAGALSDAVHVEAADVFPPAVPTNLAAVATAADANASASIDLSWQPVADAQLAGYQVYRSEGAGDWQRISPALQVGSAFHDAQVQPGHSYRYAVSAVALNGHESSRSEEAQESVPAP